MTSLMWGNTKGQRSKQHRKSGATNPITSRIATSEVDALARLLTANPELTGANPCQRSR